MSVSGQHHLIEVFLDVPVLVDYPLWDRPGLPRASRSGHFWEKKSNLRSTLVVVMGIGKEIEKRSCFCWPPAPAIHWLASRTIFVDPVLPTAAAGFVDG